MRPQPITGNYSQQYTILARARRVCDPCGIPVLFETALEGLVCTKNLVCPYCDEICELFSVLGESLT